MNVGKLQKVKWKSSLVIIITTLIATDRSKIRTRGPYQEQKTIIITFFDN